MTKGFVMFTLVQKFVVNSVVIYVTLIVNTLLQVLHIDVVVHSDFTRIHLIILCELFEAHCFFKVAPSSSDTLLLDISS